MFSDIRLRREPAQFEQPVVTGRVRQLLGRAICCETLPRVFAAAWRATVIGTVRSSKRHSNLK
jgi:hypothetical protein